MRIRRVTALAAAALISLSGPAALAAQGNQGNQGKGAAHKANKEASQGATQGSGKNGDLRSEDVLGIVFSEIERQLIRDYFHDVQGSGKGLPPGLAKRESLPPGLQKQLVRNGALPPGLQAKALPGDLVTRLPKRGPGYDRVVVGNDVLLIRSGTRIILDVLKDVLRS